MKNTTEKVIFNIDSKLKKKLKITSVNKGISMTEFINSLITEKLTPNKN